MGFRIRYSNFWPNFIPEEFLFTQILKRITKNNVEIIKTDEESVDLEIFSVFIDLPWKNRATRKITKVAKLVPPTSTIRELLPSELKVYEKGRAKKRIWYTGENVRPPVDIFDATFSFENFSEKARNFFLPYWMVRLDWELWTPSKEFEITPTISTLMSNRPGKLLNEKICYFSGHSNRNREKILELLETLMYVQKYGSKYDRYVQSKFNISQQYGFQFCPENCMYPNYVTEKLQEAWTARNIPIWFGCDDVGFFNKNAFFDLTGMKKEDIYDTFLNLDTEELFFKSEQPILNIRPTIADTYNFFLQIVS